VHAADHLRKLVGAPRQGFTARHQRRVGGEPARSGGVPEVTCARRDQPLGIGLEDLDSVDRTGAQRRLVLGHRLVGDAFHTCWIDAVAPEIVLQADPGRRHLGDGGEFHRKNVGKAEIRTRFRAHHEERIAGDDVAEADEVRAGIGIARHHHAQWTAPHHVDLAGAQCPACRYRVGRGPELDIDAGPAECASRMRGIERRIEQRSEILGQDDRHGPPINQVRTGQRRRATPHGHEQDWGLPAMQAPEPNRRKLARPSGIGSRSCALPERTRPRSFSSGRKGARRHFRQAPRPGVTAHLPQCRPTC
jgi:hypothetical protein